MKKRLQRGLVIALSSIMVFGTVPCTTFAADAGANLKVDSLVSEESVDFTEVVDYTVEENYQDAVSVADKQNMESSELSMNVQSARSVQSNNWVWPTYVHTLKNDWPNYSSGSYHGGTDFPVPLNTDVHSSCEGDVVSVKYLTTSYGKHIKIKANVNGQIVYIRYCHLNQILVSEGQHVTAGQVIGKSGSTGNSTGPHLHYEVRNSADSYSNALNPRLYLPGTSYTYESSSNSDSCNCSDSYAGNYTCTSNSTLNIRSGHGSGYSVIGSIPSGATVYVSKADGSWAHVSYNEVNGYASMQYLSKIPDTHNPEGHMESISGGIGTISLSGWVFDRDVPDQAVEVHVYVGGPAGSADVKWIKTGIIADAYRPDVDNVYGQGKYHGIAGTLDVPLSGECDVYIYAINAGGGNHNPCIGSGKVTIQEKDLTGPEITDYKISDIGIEGYTVRCKVTDKSGVDRVQFPTWTANNDQDDLADDWAVNAAYTGTKNGDVYTYRVKTSMHNNEKGSYVTHIYAYDKYGNVNVKALDSVVVPDLPDSTMELGNDFYAKIQNYVTKTMLAKVNTGKEWDAYFRDEDDSRDQIWHFVRNGSEESYTISCEGNEPLVLSVEKEEDSDYNNVKVDLRSESSGQKWKILKKDGRYYLQPLCSETRVLDVKNATADTVSAEINSYNEYGGCGFEIIKTEKQTELLQSKNLVAEGNYGGHSYQVFDQKMSWTDAKRACEALGGHLVTIKDEGEQTFIETLLKNGNASMDLYWLGLYYRYQTGFSWVTDEDVDYENWASSYPLAGLAANPMGYCAHMYGANQTDSAFEWRNVNNAYAANMGVICEFETVKTSVDDVSGVVIGGRAADALRINWKKDSKASGYILEQYKNGSWTRIARIGSNATTTYRVEKLVPSTTYQFRIHAFAFDGKTPVYGNHTYMNGKTNPAIISGAKIGGRAADALRLNWNKDSKASGYIVEQYKNGSWTRIARIGSNATTTYRVEKLSPSTTYKFRVQSFGFDGKTALYGNYAYVNGKTNPAIMSGLKIGGTAKDALRLNWNKDSKASGYIIEQYKNRKWTRIARIGSNATTTYRVEKLQSKTTYKFRVKSFGFDGSTAIYGAYGYINGTTY